jgi:hypothetical protein
VDFPWAERADAAPPLRPPSRPRTLPGPPDVPASRQSSKHEALPPLGGPLSAGVRRRRALRAQQPGCAANRAGDPESLCSSDDCPRSRSCHRVQSCVGGRLHRPGKARGMPVRATGAPGPEGRDGPSPDRAPTLPTRPRGAPGLLR